MKKLSLIAISALCLVLLAGCSGGSTEDANIDKDLGKGTPPPQLQGSTPAGGAGAPAAGGSDAPVSTP